MNDPESRSTVLFWMMMTTTATTIISDWKKIKEIAFKEKKYEKEERESKNLHRYIALNHKYNCLVLS